MSDFEANSPLVGSQKGSEPSGVRGSSTASVAEQWLTGLIGVLSVIMVVSTLLEILFKPTTPTLDYFGWIESVSEILSGNLDGVFFLAHTYHPFLPLCPLATFSVNALLFSWSAKIDLVFGSLLALAKVSLLAACFWDRASPYKSVRLLFILICFQFSATHWSVLGWGINTICWGWATLGFVLGLLGIVRGANNKFGPFLMLAGGLLSSYSLANFVPLWFVYLLSMIVLKVRFKLWLPVWVLGVLLSLSQYLCFPSMSRPAIHVSIDQVGFFLTLMGQQMCNYADGSKTLEVIGGSLGLLVVLAYLGFLIAVRKPLLSRSLPPRWVVVLAVGAYALTSAALISLVRTNVAPWYVEVTSFAWVALAGLLVFGGPGIKRSLWLTGGLVLLLFVQFRSYDTNDWFPGSRSRSGEAVLRNFATAPTTSIKYLHTDSYAGFTAGAEALYRRRWMTFSPGLHPGRLTLQGDYCLANVRRAGLTAAAIQWIDKQGRPMPYSSSRELDCRLPAGSSISWTVSIPEGSRNARLRFGIISNGKGTASGQPVLAVHDARSQVVHSVSASAPSPVEINLSQFGLKDLTLKFSATTSGITLLRPEIEFEKMPSPVVSLPIRPSNTDLFSSRPEPTETDLVLDPFQSDSWVGTGLKATSFSPDKSLLAITSASSQLYLKVPLDVEIAKYQYLSFALQQSSPTVPSSAIQLLLNGTDVRTVVVPLLTDEVSHRYSVDLDLCQLPASARLTNIIFMPAYTSPAGGQKLKVKAIRLISRAGLTD